MATILVVDDSETVRLQIRKALEEGGHEVVEAGDGIAGLDALKEHPLIKIILCDVNMPRLDGISMCMKIQENEVTKGIPIIMITTESSPEMKQKSKDAGVKAWITKPFVAEKLLKAVSVLSAQK